MSKQSGNTIIIQTVVKPFFVFELGKEIHYFAEQKEFYNAMEHIEITKDTTIMINRGPGSYSGIRIGLSYVLGLIHGGLIANKNVTYFTTFDLSQITEKDIFLKGWPRTGGDFDTVKGYFFNKNDRSIKYTELKNVPQQSVILLESSDSFESAEGNPTQHLADLISVESLEKLASTKIPESNREPLYINPVHTT